MIYHMSAVPRFGACVSYPQKGSRKLRHKILRTYDKAHIGNGICRRLRDTSSEFITHATVFVNGIWLK